MTFKKGHEVRARVQRPNGPPGRFYRLPFAEFRWGRRTKGNHRGNPEALRRAVRSLPKGQRTAIELLKLREMSLKEAAAASGMSIGALKVSVHRAIKTLRASLDG